jgi:hypothetical protein
MQQVSVLETNIGSSTTGNSANTQIIFNDNGVLRGDAGLTYNAATDLLTVASATITGNLTVGVGDITAQNGRFATVANGQTVGLLLNSFVPGGSWDNYILNNSGNASTTATMNFGRLTSLLYGFIRTNNNSQNLQLGTFGTGSVEFFQNNSTAMTLNSSGLGVGGIPAAKLHIVGGASATVDIARFAASSGPYIGIGTEGTNYTWIQSFGGKPLQINPQGNDTILNPSTGNVGVGVTPSAWSASYKVLDIAGGGGITSLSNGLYLASNGYENSGWKKKGAGYANLLLNVSGEYRFNTSTLGGGAAGDAITFTQAMTLDASGNLLVGRTSVAGSERLCVEKDQAANEIARFRATHATDPYGLAIQYTANISTAANDFAAYYVNATTIRFGFRSNGGMANYQANNVNLSDSRTKTDIKPLASYWNKIKALELVTFKYNDQSHSDDNIGLIAQQVESVAPEFVDVDGFGKTPEDGVPLKTIYTTDLYHASIKALQEAMARIEVLEAKLA